MPGLVYRLCYYCGELVPYYAEIAGIRQYYEHACRIKKKVINWVEEDKKE